MHGNVYTASLSDVNALGWAVINALNECIDGLEDDPHAKIDNKTEPIIVSTKVKNWNMLMKTTRSISIYLKKEDHTLEFEPLRFGGPSGPNRGYHLIKDKIVTSDLVISHIGEALIKAVEASENPYLKQ
jgi:hypothetical protein